MSEPKRDLVTRAQQAALEAELAELEGPRRAEAVQAIKTAREFGDLSENFEYHAAKNEQGLLERRIAILRARLDHAIVVDEADGSSGAVSIGSIVELEDESGDRLEVELSIVGGAGAVSPDSPLGAALLGARTGDTVDVQAPRGSWRARIISIQRS
ncbi:MAG: GreA/GreB family elongation factor [Gaiellaceae bacterium]